MKNKPIFKVTFQCGHSEFFTEGHVQDCGNGLKFDGVNPWEAPKGEDGTYKANAVCAKCREPKGVNR